jgi:hypothetical protein
MNGASESHRPAIVELTGLARAQLRAVSRYATYAVAGEAVAEAARELFARLRSDPREFGAVMYRVRKLRMEVRHAVVPPLYVEYGIRDQRPHVIIRHVARLPESAD